MTTTFDTIRAGQISTLQALTPAKPGRPFRVHGEPLPFMGWVEANPAGCFRRFEILRNWDDEQLPTADGSIEGARHTMELRVAYPKRDRGLYGSTNERSYEAFLDSDRRQIDAAIGLNGGSNYVANQDVCRLTTMAEVEAGDAAVLSMTFELLYDRSV